MIPAAFVRLPTVSRGEVRPWSVYSRGSGSDLCLNLLPLASVSGATAEAGDKRGHG